MVAIYLGEVVTDYKHRPEGQKASASGALLAATRSRCATNGAATLPATKCGQAEQAGSVASEQWATEETPS